MAKQQEDLISAYEYAARKGVSATIVYRKVNSGEIEVKLIGKTKYIDWYKYNHIDFPKGGGIRQSAS